jgi:adenylate cyclase
VLRRMFSDWNMKIFNLNEQAEALPFAFREMLTALLESSHTISQYTQPTVFRMLEHGLNPTRIPPRRKRVTVLCSDIIGFSHFAEHLKPLDMIELVNSHVEMCARAVSAHGGEVNKLTGDGVLAYFSAQTTDAALASAVELLKQMQRRRSHARKSSPHRVLYGGVGLSNGIVYEGNVGHATKRDFTILGNAVNTASRLESLTRDLGVRLTLGPAVVRRAEQSWPFVSVGKHRLKGQSRAFEVFTLRSVRALDVAAVYRDIKRHVRQ